MMSSIEADYAVGKRAEWEESIYKYFDWYPKPVFIHRTNERVQLKCLKSSDNSDI